MKQIKTILALLLCLCMLPFSALAAAADDGTLDTTTYTPEESGLYIVAIMHNGSLLPTVFTGDEVPAPQVAVSVTAGATAAQEVDYNVYYLSAGTQYTIRAESDVDYIHDDQGEWALVIAPVEVQTLELNKTLAEGEWFSFAPEQDGDYSFFTAAQPAFLEIFAPGKQGGDWDGYANDKEMYRQGAANLANNYAQYEAAQQEYDQGKALVDSKRAEYEAAKLKYQESQELYNKTLDKIDSYQKLLDYAKTSGLLDEDSPFDQAKQNRYDRIKTLLKVGSSLLPNIDKNIVDELPDSYKDLPAHLTQKIEENETIKENLEAMMADAEAQLAEYEEAEKQLAEAETKLQAAKQQLTDGETQLAAAREKIQADADAIMSSASALAAGGDEGLALQKAAWLTEADDALTATLKAGTVYTVHILSGDPAAVRVTNDPEANPVVDKSKLEQAITDARENDTTLYTDESVAALRAALADAEAVLADPGATQAEVDAAAKAVNDAVSALERIEDNPSAVDKSALKEAIAIAEVVDRDKYTDDSLSAMYQALNAAEAVNGNADATQAEVDAAAKALNDAIQALKEKPVTPTVDKTALEKAITDAEAVDTSKYTDDSVAAMTKALSDAKTVNGNADATQADVDAAAQALNDAVKALKEKPAGVDKSELQKAISEAEAIDRDKYTEDSLQALDAALITARFVNLFSSSQDRVDEVTQGLRNAIDALVEKEVTPPTPAVDKTALQKAITDAEAVDTSKYTDDSVAAMTKALNDAKTVNGKADATQAEVDAAVQALNDAVKALKEKPVTPPVQGADKTDLKKAIQAAEAIDRSKYTDDSVDQLDRVLSYAKSVDADKDASQARVTNAAALLNNAIDDLKEKSADPQQPDKCDGGANCPSKIFKDVNQKKWYHEAIDYAIVNKLFNGTSPNTFEPDTAMTRGMLVTVLYRMENEPGAKTTPAFTDLRQNWYKTAVAWAAENEIVNGIDATHFAPDAKVTREQAMTMLIRYAQFKGYDTSAREDLSAFKDAASVRSWALDAMQWGVSVGLIQGVGGGMLDPRGDSSRAQVATILMRFRENIAK